MALLEHKQTLETARAAIIARSAYVIKAPADKRTALPAFIEHPSAPLNDAERDAFLTIMDDESAPNEALRSGAEWFKSLGL